MEFRSFWLTIIQILAFSSIVLSELDADADYSQYTMGMGGQGGGMPGMPGQQKRAKPIAKLHARIQCQVCEQVVKEVVREAKKLKSKEKSVVTEEDLLNLLDRSCDPFEDEGAWITRFDLQKKPPKLEMVQMGTNEQVGECGRECETIGESCAKIISDNDIEISEHLYKEPKRSTLRNAVCTQLCRKEKHDIKKTSKVGKEKWREGDPEQRQMMKLMKDMPQGVQMYDTAAMQDDDMYGMGMGGGMGGGMGMDEMGMGDMAGMEEEYAAWLAAQEAAGGMPSEPEEVGLGDSIKGAYEGAKDWVGGLFGGEEEENKEL